MDGATTSLHKRKLDEVLKKRAVKSTKVNGAKLEKDRAFIKDGPKLEPLPTGSFERLQSNQLFEKILCYLTSPIDMINTSKVCSSFQDILDEGVTIEVFKALKEKRYIRIKNAENDERARQQNRKLLNLRVISKAWKRATKETFLNLYSGEWHSTFLDKKTNWWITAKYPNVVMFEKPEDIDRAMEVFKRSNSVSSLLQILIISERSCLTSLQYFGKLLVFFIEHGKSIPGIILIWDLRIVTEEVLMLRQCLLTSAVALNGQHLKALKLWIFDSRDLTSEELAQFSEYLLKIKIPDLLSLEVFNAYYYNDPRDDPIIMEILRKSPNLKAVQLPEVNTREDAHNEPMLSVLKSLPIAYFNVFHVLPTQLEYSLLTMISWPLNKITMSRILHASGSELFPILNRFGNTLEHLELSCIPEPEMTGLASFQLQLPKLKVLYLERQFNYGTSIRSHVRFILRLNSLEYLRLTYDEADRDKVDQYPLMLLQIQGFWERMEESNIWKCFPYLRTFEIVIKAEESRSSILYEKYGNDVYKSRRQLPSATLRVTSPLD